MKTTTISDVLIELERQLDELNILNQTEARSRYLSIAITKLEDCILRLRASLGEL